MRIVIFGSPGSGKGTQAQMIAEHFHLKRVSLGDILREEVKKNTELGEKVKSFMSKGLLVPDSLVRNVIEVNLGNGEFILDGYPRNLNQAEVLDQILKEKNKDIDAFIYLGIGEATLINRLTKRRICKSCGANYHLENMPPKKEDICDSCGSKLAKREDDNLSVIKKRWEIFLKESKEILKFYESKDKLINIDGEGNKDEVFERIKNKLQCLPH